MMDFNMTTNAFYSIFAVLLAIILYFSLIIKTRHRIVNGLKVLIPLLMFLFSLTFLSGRLTGFVVYDNMHDSDLFFFNFLGLLVFLFLVLLVSARERKAKKMAEIKAIRGEVLRRI